MKNIKKRKNKLIALIEDDGVLSDLITLKLEKAGYSVAATSNGKEAVGLIKKHSPDLVLLDIMLPGKNGFTILNELKTEGLLPKLPIIIISNSGQPVDTNRALEMGVRDCIIKVNFDPEELLEKIISVIEPVPISSSLKSATQADLANDHPSILIVEDDVLFIELMQIKFTQRKYNVLVAQKVDEAREILNKKKVDLILLDIVLPGVDGFTFLKELRQDGRWKDLPVIISSNLGQKEDIEHGMKLGANGYIIKAHLLPDEIVDVAEKELQKSSAAKPDVGQNK